MHEPAHIPIAFPPERSIQEATTNFLAAEAQGHTRLHDVTVRGTVRRLRRSDSKATFFRLHDTEQEIEAVVRQRYPSALPVSVINGAEVLVTGTLLRWQGSPPQIEVRSVRAISASVCAPQISKGLPHAFAMESAPAPPPKPLPEVVSALGVVTSPDGAALRDVLHVVGSRAPWIEVVVAPAQVQGRGAAESMAHALLRLQMLQPAVDAILLCRGGSASPLDYSAFADPLLLATMRISCIPVVTAVGHAGDVTPADRLAWMSYATPSLGTVALTPDRAVLRRRVQELRERVECAIPGLRLPRYQAAQETEPSAETLPLDSRPLDRSAAPAALLSEALRSLEEIACSPAPRASASSTSRAYAAAASLSLACAILDTRSVASTRLDNPTVR